MAMAVPLAPPTLGRSQPRLAPPVPARSAVAAFEASAAGINLTLIPWQKTVGTYLYGLGLDDRWLYPEVAVVVSRQNGKTEILMPHVLRRLEMGRRMLHAAQTRELPRRLFKRLAPVVMRKYPDAIVRFGAGQESIELPNGGLYLIAAATSGGARGIDAIDDLLVDEVRQIDEDFVAAAVPTTITSPNPQILWLSNAGHELSLVLNAIRARASEDPSLAYLEWSADPSRAADDREGWVEANPSIGHEAFPHLVDSLERLYMSSRLSGSMARFETEHLCRWVATLREPLVNGQAWLGAKAQEPLGAPVRSFMGISLDPSGTRASAAVAWNRPDGTVGLRLVIEGTGSPIDTDKLGKAMRAKAREMGAQVVGFDPLTDAVLAKYFRKAEPVAGAKYANASARFVAAVAAGEVNGLQWEDCAAVGDDLTWTAKKPHDESGSFQAVRADDDRPIPAALAAIRAVWLASVPRLDPVNRKSVPSAVGF